MGDRARPRCSRWARGGRCPAGSRCRHRLRSSDGSHR
ncbi:MAG TPA: hypothetical protein ENK18_03575 [Deltaproteobacteria bacterium]|nr:hypothetical protein [Deltaproteobacteria bacterium]